MAGGVRTDRLGTPVSALWISIFQMKQVHRIICKFVQLGQTQVPLYYFLQVYISFMIDHQFMGSYYRERQPFKLCYILLLLNLCCYCCVSGKYDFYFVKEVFCFTSDPFMFILQAFCQPGSSHRHRSTRSPSDPTIPLVSSENMTWYAQYCSLGLLTLSKCNVFLSSYSSFKRCHQMSSSSRDVIDTECFYFQLGVSRHCCLEKKIYINHVDQQYIFYLSATFT